MLTKQQIHSRTKTVTRRIGWRNLKPGDILSGVEKGMGLKAGEKIVRLATIRIINVSVEPLRRITDDLDYGFEECQKEGFGDHPVLHCPSEFTKFFCRSHKNCTPETEVTRIEFEYLN